MFYIDKQKQTKKYGMTNNCAYISLKIFLSFNASFVLIDVLLFLKRKMMIYVFLV